MKKLILMMFIMIFLVGTVSALTLTTWDNIKYYEEETKTITIKNNFILKTLEKATLLSNTYNCGVNCKAEKEITLYEDGILIDDLRFYRLFTDGTKELSEPRTHNLLYLKDIGESICDGKLLFTQKNGTEIRECHVEFNGNNKDWIQYPLGSEVKAGTYQVELIGTKKINRIYDWQIKLQGRWIDEWATWGNISLGDDAEVLLISPLNNTSFKIGDTVSYNATANITGGSTLTNISLYDTSTGTWLLNETINLSGILEATVDDNNGINLAGSGTETSVWTGNKIEPNVDLRLNNITRHISVTATTAYVLADTSPKFILAQATFSGNSAEFSFDMDAGTAYWVVADSGGSTYNRRSGAATDLPGNPIIGVNLNWTDGLFANATNSNNIFNIVSVNTSIRTPAPTFSAQNFSKIVLNETIWNVQACDSDNICGFATNNRTIIIEPTITVFSPTNITHTTSTIFFNATNSTSVDKWIVNYNGTNVTLPNINTTLEVEDGFFQLLLYANNSDTEIFGLNNTIFFSVDANAPTLNVTLPFGVIDFQDISNNQTLNWNVSDLNIDTCIFQYNEANTTLTCADNTTSFTIKDSRTLTFFVNDTLGNSNSQVVNWSYLILQTSTTFNSSSFETANEEFTVNVTTNGSVITAGSLTFDGTENTGATITNPAGDNFSITKSITIPVSIGTKTHNFNLTISGKIINTTSQTQVINATNFTLCGAAPLDIPFINITFKNETLAEEDVNATISSTWVFSLSSLSEANKTLSFTDATQKLNFTFCGSPNRTINIQIDIDYNNDISQQRSFSSTRTISNIMATEVLYLLPTSLGIFSPFKTTNINGDTISFVSATITRVLNAQTIVVANGLTDSSGFATFFVDPNVAHTATFSKTGFADNVFIFTPSTDLRTVVMGGGGVISNGTIVTRGTAYTITPIASTLANNTDFTFTFNVTSNLTTITLISMNITNSSNSELLFVSNAGVGNLSGTLNTGNNTILFGNFLIQTAEETISVTRTWLIFTTFAGDYSLFTQFTLAKDNELISEFMRLLIILSFMAGVLIFMNMGKVIETSESNIAVLLLMTWAFSLVGWLDTGLAVSTTDSGINRLGEFSNQFGIAILLTLPGLFFILRRLFIRVPR